MLTGNKYLLIISWSRKTTTGDIKGNLIKEFLTEEEMEDEINYRKRLTETEGYGREILNILRYEKLDS